jgi:alanine racemase
VQSPEVLISASALRENFALLRAHSGNQALFPVIKANSYGHGAVPVARILEAAYGPVELPLFCVARWAEMEELRGAGITRGILVLSHVGAEEVERASVGSRTGEVHLCVNGMDDVERLLALSARGRRSLAGLHLNLNTGMNRLGFRVQETPRSPELAAAVPRLLEAGFSIRGIMSHLARSEEEPPAYTQQQHALFLAAIEALRREWPGKAFPEWIHLSNSSSIGRALPGTNACRPGILLWGAYQDPAHRQQAAKLELRPVLEARAPLRQVIRVRAGEGVGYGHRFKAPRDSLIGTVCLGYADGLPRTLSRRADQDWKAGFVLRGQRVPLAGTVSMDMAMVDLTEHPEGPAIEAALAKPGHTEWAWWIGQGQTAEDVAEAAGTISYEIFCRLALRLRRRVVEGAVL